MKCFLYAECDNLSGFMLRILPSHDAPEVFVALQNRLNTLQPNQIARTIEYRLLGVIDDETLDGELYTVKTKIGDLQPSIAKLEAYRNAHREEYERKQG